jgi:hypothetical protein
MTRIVVGADGTVKHAALVRPSKYPDYDRAVVAALAHCRYSPALMQRPAGRHDPALAADPHARHGAALKRSLSPARDPHGRC